MKYFEQKFVYKLERILLNYVCACRYSTLVFYIYSK